MASIFLLEDDQTFATILTNFLVKQGHEVQACYKVKEADSILAANSFNLLLLDYRLPDGTGLDVLALARKHHHACPAIMMTSINDVATAVKAMRSGIFNYITKPINHEEFLLVMNEALVFSNAPQQTGVTTNAKPAMLEGTSEAAKKVGEHIALVAPTDMSVMILGESGTGKEHIARSIHQQSNRHNNPFVAIDCGALSSDLAASELFGHTKGAFTGSLNDKKGHFEMANGGTLFLDEAGNLSYDVQVKLLRALQERVIQPVGSNAMIKVDVRIISATNEDLINSVQQGQFREDLYHRLNEFKIQVPPLRLRGKDIWLFVDRFLEEANRDLDRHVTGLSTEVKQTLERYDWPGNLRELKNVIRRMVLLTRGAIAEESALPDEMIDMIEFRNEATNLKALQETTEKEMITQTLEKVKYNKSKAARLLNIDRKTLYSKLERYGIK